MKPQKKAEIKEKIAELRRRYAKLKAACDSYARINLATVENYSREIETLEAQLKSQAS